MASQDTRLSKFEVDFKKQQSEMTNKIDTVLKAITDRIAGTLPSDTAKNLKLGTRLVSSAHKYVDSLELGKNRSAFVQGEIPTKIEDPRLFTLPCRLGDSKPFDTLANIGSCVNIILLYLFKKLNIGLLEETDHIFGLADGTKSCPVGIVKDVEVHIGKLKLLNDFYVIVMRKDTETPLLVGRGFLATANAVIDCRMAKIAIGKGITSSDGVGAQTPYYARKDFLDCHLPGEWEISRDAELNPFKDTLVFRRMVEFVGAIHINLKCNMWESDDLIRKPINWNKPPKNRDGAWHAKIRLIDHDGEEFTKTLQSIPTTRKLSERESPREIIDLDHFYDT
ncbi:MAK10-like protein [Tanacetum coccineum]|uniref:MAK10-like protein n=1 Tax=Tanacetum coccineum TaxID=301880 RepID=A0ABQ5HXL2_9ASTR